MLSYLFSFPSPGNAMVVGVCWSGGRYFGCIAYVRRQYLFLYQADVLFFIFSF